MAGEHRGGRGRGCHLAEMPAGDGPRPPAPPGAARAAGMAPNPRCGARPRPLPLRAHAYTCWPWALRRPCAPEPRRLREADALDVVLYCVGGAHTNHIRHQVAQPGRGQHRQPQLGAKVVVYLLARHKLCVWGGQPGGGGRCSGGIWAGMAGRRRATACASANRGWHACAGRARAKLASWQPTRAKPSWHAPVGAQRARLPPTMMALSRMPKKMNGKPEANATAASCRVDGLSSLHGWEGVMVGAAAAGQHPRWVGGQARESKQHWCAVQAAGAGRAPHLTCESLPSMRWYRTACWICCLQAGAAGYQAAQLGAAHPACL